MFNKRNPMKYFSGSAFARLPLYKLVAGGTAAALTASVGLGVFAASFVPAPAPEATPTPTPVATPETAAPTPTPEPDIPLLADITVIQQDIGVQLYTLPEETPETAPTPTPAEESEALPNKHPLLGVEAAITLTDTEGAVTEYAVDPETGTALAEDVEPGEYTVAIQPIEGYILPEASTVEVQEKVIYKADVEAVKEKIKQASEVNESAEDSGGGAAPIAEEVVDTVQYAESSKEESGRKTVYTAKLSSSGHLLFADGSESPYLPVYKDGTQELTGAQRDASASANAMSVWLPGAADSIVTLGRNGRTMAMAHRNDEPQGEEDKIDLLEGTGADGTGTTPSPDPSAEPSTSPSPSPEVTTAPEPTPEPTPEATPTPTPEPTPTPTPEATPTPTPDKTADWPDAIEAAKLAEYGFAVTGTETVEYIYTGWQEIDGATYYYDPATHQPVTGSQVIQGNVYTFGADGALNRTSRGIDVSKFQGSIDWNAVKADGITFAIIRCGYRGYGTGALVEDATFRQNIQGAINAGLRVGVYFYSQAINEAEAVEEASMVLSLVSGYSLPLGVYYDTETVAGGRANAISASERTACAVAFCETIRNAGYQAGVYSYASWFYNALNFANISKYNIWIAQYRDTLDFNYHYNIWQYTGSGRVNGISTAVDMNIG